MFMNPQFSSIHCADLFAGVGGFSKAALDIGLRVKAAVEIDSHACASYRHNLIDNADHPPRLYQNDIESLDPRTVAKECFTQTAPCDLVLGGPPCQGFSVHRINGAGIDDPRNRLLHRYFEFVTALKPRLFLLENVPGLLWPRHQSYLEEFYRVAAVNGYTLADPVVLDARDYGVPQRRRRVFILGARKDIPLPTEWPPPRTHGSAEAILLHPSLIPWKTAQEVFRAAPDGDENNVHMSHGPELIKAFKKTPPNGGSRHDSGRLLKCHDGHDGHKDVYGRIDPSKPGPTMTTACINPSKGRFVHPTEHHGITVRQAARLQTFPDDFIFKGGIIAAGKQIGNAVPVDLGKAVLDFLATYLLQLRIAPPPKTRKRRRIHTHA